MEDEFKPEVITDYYGNLQVLLTECRQNDYTIKLQSY